MAVCSGAAYRVRLSLPEGASEGRRPGDAVVLTLAARGRLLGSMAGTVVADGSAGASTMESETGENQPLFARLLEGDRVRISLGRAGYDIDPRGGRSVLVAFTEACRTPR